MRKIISLIALFGSTPAWGEAPSRGDVSIRALSYQGNGCRPGTAVVNLSEDNQAFTVLFSDYVLDTSVTDGRPQRKLCDLNLQLDAPLGWSFTVFGIQVRGYARIDAGAVGVQTVMARVGNSMPQVGRIVLQGPYDADYMNASSVSTQSVEWSPCGVSARQRNFMIRTAINIRPANGFTDAQGDVDNPSLGHNLPRGLMTVDSIDGSRMRHDYYLAWTRCPGPGPGGQPGGGAPGGGQPGGPGGGMPGGRPGGGMPGHGGGSGGGPGRIGHSFSAACTLNVEGRSFSGAASGPEQNVARNQAIRQAMQQCLAAFAGRPLALRCAASSVSCR